MIESNINAVSSVVTKAVDLEQMIQEVVQAFLYAIVAFFLLKLLCGSLFRNHEGKSKPLPPGPPRLPLIGNLHQLGHPLHRVLHDLSLKYGDIMFLQLGISPTLVISSPDLARDVFKTHDANLSGRSTSIAVDVFSYGGQGIVFAPYGEYWRELRKVVVTELLSLKRVLFFRPIREDEVNLLIHSIARFNSSAFDIKKLLLSLSNSILCRVAFGRTYNGEGRKTPQVILEELQILVGTISLPDFIPSLSWLNKLNGFEKRLKLNWKELDELCDLVIGEHLNPNGRKPDNEDLIDVLLRLQRGNTDSFVITNSMIKAVIVDMLIGGTDTTAATLVWAMTELIRNPEVLKKAQEELRGKVKKERVEECDLDELSYLRCVVKETLRMYPPGPLLIPRKTEVDCEIKGYHVPANTTVFFNAWTNAMDGDWWEKPLEFWPDRFMGSEVDFRGKHSQLIPFGMGRRSCPGLNFASTVIELALANLLHSFDWELPENMSLKDIDREEGVGIVLYKKNALFLVAKPYIST